MSKLFAALLEFPMSLFWYSNKIIFRSVFI